MKDNFLYKYDDYDGIEEIADYNSLGWDSNFLFNPNNKDQAKLIKRRPCKHCFSTKRFFPSYKTFYMLN